MSKQVSPHHPTSFSNPSLASWLLNSTGAAWLWLFVRLYIGYTWLTSGLEKLGNPAWVENGFALKGFWEFAISIPAAPQRPPIAFDWYRTFIMGLLEGGHYVWFAKVVVAGELLVGIALILGLFTGISALAGAFMNWNFMMAGSASINPVLFPLSLLLVLAWRVSGYIGLDRWLLPMLGTPWQPGKLFGNETRQPIPVTVKHS